VAKRIARGRQTDRWMHMSNIAYAMFGASITLQYMVTRSSATAEGQCDESCQLKSCQLPHNSAETTCMTSPEEIEVMKLEGYSGPMCNKHVHSTMT